MKDSYILKKLRLEVLEAGETDRAEALERAIVLIDAKAAGERMATSVKSEVIPVKRDRIACFFNRPNGYIRL